MIIQTPDSGSIRARRVDDGTIDLEVKNPEGETTASVVIGDTQAWALLLALGEVLRV